jgi:glycosyltransferase involved in cell wall biosynthesis
MLAPRPRVALVHYSAPPVVGGVEVVVGAQARILARAGYDVRVVAGRGRRADVGVPLVRLPLLDTRHPRTVAARRELAAGRIPDRFAELVAELRRNLAAALEGVDLVVAHNVATVHFNLALSVALRDVAATGDRAWLLWVHDVAAAMAGRAGELHAGPPWDVVREPWPGATVVAVSEHRRDQYAALTGLEPSSILVVPNGIDVAASLRLHPATRELVERTGLRSAAPILLVPSRLVPRKNIELALRVTAELAADEPGVHLIVTGALDPHDEAARLYRGFLRALVAELDVEERVTFVAELVRGAAAAAVVRDLYRLADLLFLPSRDEGFGLPVLEAAVARLPIACADIPTLRGLAGEGAVLFAPDASPAEVARLVRGRLAADDGYRRATRVRREHSWEAVAPTFLSVVAASLGRR